MHLLYLLVLLFSVMGLGILDRRFALAYFYDRRATLGTLGIGVMFFLVWDVLGVRLNIFFVGQTKYLTGIRVLPEVPLEEIFFLIVLCYSALLAWRGSERIWPRT